MRDRSFGRERRWVSLRSAHPEDFHRLAILFLHLTFTRLEHPGRRLTFSAINPVRGTGCYVGRRQLASLERRIFTSTRPTGGAIMLRMMLVGLLIPLCVGVLVAMELRTPTREALVAVQPLAETTIDVSDSHDVLAKADRLEVAAASSEAPAQPAPVNEDISQPEVVSVGASEPPMLINRQRHGPKSKKVAIAARPKSKQRPVAAKAANVKTATIKAVAIQTAAIKRTVIAERPKVASDTETCRLSAFGGLRKALNSVDCEI